MKKKKLFYNTSSLELVNLYKIIIIVLMVFLAIISTLSIIILVSTQNAYKYAYIDLKGTLGLSYYCRDKKCSDDNSQKIDVKEFLDIRKEKNKNGR